MADADPSGHPRRAVLGLLGSGVIGWLTGCGGGDGDGGTRTVSTSVAMSPTSSSSATRHPTTPSLTPSPTSSTPTTSPARQTSRSTSRPTMTNGPTVTASPPGRDQADIVVATDETGDYNSVQAAIDAVPTNDATETVIYVASGRYHEKLQLPANRSNVTLVGESASNTVLTYDENARDAGGTTESASVSIFADEFTAYRLTFENAAEPLAQKVAVLAESDRQYYANCRFLSHQDTLYVRGNGHRQYFLDCEIVGTTDFVFGDADAVFDRCDVICRDSASVITAANTLAESQIGLVFKHCSVVGATPANQVHLGRPWGPYARTAFVDCELSEIIHPDGWSTWSGNDNHETARYVECANSGAGFTPDERVDWATVLDPTRLGEYYLVFEKWDPLEQGG